MRVISIKFYRPQEGDIASYGDEFNQLLDHFIGGSDRWDVSSSHGIAKLPGTGVQIQRYESGPEIIDLVLTHLPAWLTAITGLIVVWQQLNTRTVKITGCGNTYEGKIQDKAALEQIVRQLCANQQ